MLCSIVYGNPILNKRISLDAEDIPLERIFSSIEVQTNAFFAFQSDIIDLKQQITIQIHDEFFETALTKILQPLDLDFFISGNQIIVYKKKVKNKPKEVEIHNTCTDTITYTIFDTVMIPDTTIVYKIDTLNVYDTVVVKTYGTRNSSNRRKKAESEMLLSVDDRVLLSPYRGNIPQGEFNDEFDIQNGNTFSNELNINIGTMVNNWIFTIGLGYKISLQNIDYSITDVTYKSGTEIVQQTIINIDTLSMFTIPGVDTNWNINIDTTILDKERFIDLSDTSVQTMQHMNSFHYINIPISCGYKYKLNRKTDFISYARLTTHVLAGYKGYTVTNTSNPQIIELSDSYMAPVYFSGTISIGFQFKINKQMNFCLLPTVTQQLTPVILHEEVSHKLQTEFGLGFGINYKIN